MKTKHHLNHLKLALIVGSLALPLITQAGQHPRYKLIDLGTFGGPASTLIDFSKIVNNQGTFVGGADTARPDPFAPNCFSPSCVVQHAFQWQKGVLTDLGALPGGGSSFAACINEPGEVVGVSQTGLLDPLAGIPEAVDRDLTSSLLPQGNHRINARRSARRNDARQEGHDRDDAGHCAERQRIGRLHLE